MLKQMQEFPDLLLSCLHSVKFNSKEYYSFFISYQHPVFKSL